MGLFWSFSDKVFRELKLDLAYVIYWFIGFMATMMETVSVSVNSVFLHKKGYFGFYFLFSIAYFSDIWQSKLP